MIDPAFGMCCVNGQTEFGFSHFHLLLGVPFSLFFFTDRADSRAENHAPHGTIAEISDTLHA